MTQQAQNDYYKSEEEAALDYAAAVNRRSATSSPRAPTWCRSTSPICRRSRRRRALRAQGLESCAARSDRRHRRAYLLRLRGLPEGQARGLLLPARALRLLVQSDSIETAQPSLDCSVLTKLPDKKILVGCIDLSTPEIETPSTVVERIRKACGM